MLWTIGRLSNEYVMKFLLIPEDPVINSLLGVSYFLFFSVPPVWDTVCNMVIFLKIVGPIFTQLRPGHRPQELFFCRKNGEKVQKVEFWSQCHGLNCVNMGPKIFIKTINKTTKSTNNKNFLVAHSIPDGRSRKK